MQPTLVFTSAVPGMICLNGRFAGESGPDRPLMAPTAPCGALYVQYIPLECSQCATAFRCVFSGGRLMPDSLSGAGGVSALQWPNGILELEIDRPATGTEHFTVSGIPFVLEHGPEMCICSGGLHISLPPGSERPSLIHIGAVPALLGSTQSKGHYLITLSESMSACTGYLSASSIYLEGNIICALTDFSDIAGHAKLERWAAGPEGLNLLNSAPAWASGEPRWPKTAEDTAIAAVQAALLGYTDEAEGYFTPAPGNAFPLANIKETCDLCIPMKYAYPDSHPCVALVRLENDCVASVSPLRYSARMTCSLQGAWMIDWMDNRAVFT